MHTRILRKRPVVLAGPPWKAYIDRAQTLTPDLRCRTWVRGDRFRPLGMTGRKKLQDFFIDEGVSAPERSRTPLLLKGREILWVVGRRLSDTAKVKPGTRAVVEITARPVPNRRAHDTV